MTLINLCESIIYNQPVCKDASAKISNRILCPEFSLQVKDTKTYPLPSDEHLFALCWFFPGNGQLAGTFFPVQEPYSYFFDYQDNSRTQLHTHDYLELAYIVSGTLRQRISGKDIVFQQGELCLIDKNCLHQDYLPSQPSVILFLGIANEMFEDIMLNPITTERMTSFLKSALLQQKDLQQYLHLKPKSVSAVEKMDICFSHVLSELTHYDAASLHICHGYLMRIFYLLCNDYDFILSKALQKEMNWLLFDEIANYIQSNYYEISIKQLCRRFHFQEDYFNRLLKRKMGMTYTEYVQQLRMKKAEELLIHTDYNIDQIVSMTGYHNKGYFYKLFTAHYHTTPAKYRQKHQK